MKLRGFDPVTGKLNTDRISIITKSCPFRCIISAITIFNDEYKIK